MGTTTNDKKNSLSFPNTFLWGASTSAHQVEGGTHNQWTVWELENARSLAKQAEYKQTWLPHWEERTKKLATDPGNYVSDMSADHYHLYEKDFELMRRMNINAFRFSIEWSRIEPKEGVFDPVQIEHYRKYIKALKAKGIEPVVTLMHWTLPIWFAQKGGFEKRRNIKYFVRFSEKVLGEFANDLTYICTINEPEVYVSSGWLTGEWPPNKHNPIQLFWVYTNLASAHNQVARMAKRMNRGFKLSMSKNVAHHYVGDDSFMAKLTVRIMIFVSDYYYLNLVRRHLDWMGLNYYFTNRYIGRSVQNPDEKVSDLGWDMHPADIQFVLERLYKKYKVPIIITENGVADSEDEFRVWWIQQTVIGMQRAIKHGVDIQGYLHWSLLDNFEWSHGRWPRFGLVHVDYKTYKRTPRKSAVWYGQFLKKVRGLE